MVGLISEKLSGFYTKLEDKYFDVLDALDAKGLPVYKYSDFFEDKGIPSFIVTITIILLLIMLLGFAFTGANLGSGEIIVSLKDSVTGQPLRNVSLKLFDTQNTILFDKSVSDGDRVEIAALAQGTKIRILAAKDGYASFQDEFLIGKESATRAIYLNKRFVGINAMLRLTDIETGTKIKGASVTARYGDEIYNFFEDGNGLYRKDNIPEGETVLLSVTADGYNLISDQAIVFFSETIRDLSLSPSNDGFVGLANVIITVSNADGLAIEGAEVTVYNKENQAVLMKKETTQGAVSGQIQTGIQLKITIKKEGYLNYDSDVELGGLTIRKQEDKIDLIMKQGGEKLIVNVVNELGLSLSDSIVQVYSERGELIDRKISVVGGAEFSGLDPEATILITAYKEGYLPSQAKVFVGATESVPIILKEITSGNSFRLDIFTLDNIGDAVSGANVEIKYFDEDGNKLPYGFDNLRTSLAGYVAAIVALNKTYEVSAETSIMQGKTTIDITEGTIDNKVYITMLMKPNVVELKLRDLLGNKVSGTAIVSTIEGDILYDGNITNSSVFFDAYGKELVELQVKLADGNVFTENVYVKGKKIVDVIVYDKENANLAPVIEFVGIETENGEEAKGLTPGAFYWAKFSVKWPVAAEKGGVHFRTGSDSVEFADSENVALFDLALSGANTFLSYSYNPEPLPGNEALDRSNQGYVDEANKWVEGEVTNPKGTYIAKVKIRVSDFTAGKINLKYRAWSEVQDETYRTPTDSVLGNSAFNIEKASLYAETLVESLTLYESLPECNDSVCVAYNFVDETESYYDLGKFEALQGKVYALETEFTAIEGDYLQVNLTTDSNIAFIGTQSGNFKFMENSGYINTKEASVTVSLTQNGKQKIRFYFVANGIGTNIINFSATGSGEIEKQISFDSVNEKEMLIELSEKKVGLGRNFTVKVLESNLKGIENALVKIINKKGEVVKSVVGDGTDGKGKSGLYRIENDLEAGVYVVRVEASKFKSKEEALLVTMSEILSITDDLVVKMLLEEKSKYVEAKLTNNSEFTINNIIIDTENSENFKIDVVSIPMLGKNQSQTLQIRVTYIGTSESADETFTISVKGMVEGTFLTSISTTLSASYNRVMDNSCLKFEPSSLKLAMVGNNGASASDTITVKNNCEIPVSLTPITIEKTRRSNIAVNGEAISLQVGQTQNITINAINMADRLFNRNEIYNYEILYDANYITKRINVSVELINPQIALSYPGQITLFLAQNSPTAKAISAQPIFVTNVSQYSVEGIKFSTEKEYASESNVKLSIEPADMVSLEAGQSINPAKILFAEASTKYSEPVRGTVTITGKIGNLNNRIGTSDNYNYQDFLSGKYSINNYQNNSAGYTSTSNTLGVIDVLVYYSGFDCLKTTISNGTFNLSQEGLGRTATISIQNNCAEPVRVIDIKSNYPTLAFSIPNVIVQPNTTIETQMGVMVVGGQTKLRNFPITLRGMTEISQTVIEASPMNIDVFSGVNFNEEYSKAEKGISVNICGEETKELIDIPREASGNDCSQGYCDAEQASEYIAKKLDTAIKKAEAQAYSAQTTNESMLCLTKGFCTFGDIGTQQTSFDLYLKNDVVSTEAMRNAFEKFASGSTGISGISSAEFRFETGNVSDEILGAIARSGYGKQVIIDDSISGCGYYKIVISGVFPVTGEGVNFLMPILSIKAEPLIGKGKIQTKECEDSIENLVNFTPIDKKYSLGNTGGTWLTSIEAEKSLQEMAKNISKKLVNNENRVGQGTGNKLILREAPLTDALAEVCLIGGEKAIIEVNINSQLTELNSAKKDFEDEVVKLVTNAIASNFGENCLTKHAEGYKCVQLTDLSGLEGGLLLKLNSKNLSLGKDGGCVTGEVSSSLPETIEFSVIPYTENKEFLNITKITVEEISKNNETNTNNNAENNESKEDDEDSESEISEDNVLEGKKVYEIEFKGSKISKETPVKVKLDTISTDKEQKYKKEIKICAYSGEKEAEYLHANNVQFIIKAINKNTGNRKTSDADGTITILTDALHPDDLAEILGQKRKFIPNKGEKNPYYFTAMWKGEPEIIEDFRKYYGDLIELGLRNDDFTKSASGDMEATKAGAKIINESKSKAINSYLMSCGITSGLCNMATNLGGIGNAGFSALMDCGIPAATIFKADLAESYGFMSTFYEWGSDLPLIGDAFKIEEATLEARDWSPYTEAQVVGAGYGAMQAAGAKLLTQVARGKYGTLNTTAINDIATATYVKNFDTSLKNTLNSTFVNSSGSDAFRKEAVDFVQEKFTEELQRATKEKIGGFHGAHILGSRKTLTEKQAQDILRLAKEKAEKDFLDDFLLKAEAGGDATATRMRQLLTEKGITTDDELLGGLQSSTLKNKISTVRESAWKGKVSSAVDEIPNDWLAGLDDPAIMKQEVTSKVRNIVRNNLDDIARAKGVAVTDEMVEAAMRQINADDLIALASRRAASQGLNGTQLVINLTAPQGTVAQATQESYYRILNETMKNQIDDAIKAGIISDDTLKAVVKSQADDFARILKSELVGLDNVNLSKRTITAKIGELLRSPRFYGSLVLGAGCAFLGNAVGVKFYKDSIEESNQKQRNLTSIMPEGSIMKGETYKMIIETKVAGETNEEAGISAKLYWVDTDEERKEMELALANDKNNNEIKGTKLQWTSELHSKRPEERPLSEYLLYTKVTDLRPLLQSAGFKEDLRERIISAIANPYSQKLIDKYAHANGAEPMLIKGTQVPETWVGAIIATDNYSEETLEREYKTTKEDEKKVKNRIIELGKIIETKNEIKITEEVAREFYTDSDKADKFFKITSSWDKAYGQKALEKE